MNITFFKKTDDHKVDLIRDLVDELDGLYDELDVDLRYAEENDQYCSTIDKVSIRERTIMWLCGDKDKSE